MDYKFENSWVIWYHNPYDCNWDNNSYSNLIEIDNLPLFWQYYYSMENHLPDINDAMYFVMKRIDSENIIWPYWEDPHNIGGGYWSFKIDCNNTKEAWKYLMIYLLSENLCINSEDNKNINGISISPKKAFSIVKIWTKKLENVNILNKIPYFDIDNAFYKLHQSNIKNDNKKKNKI